MSYSTVERNLASGNINKLIFSYSLPAIVGTVVMSLYNIIDRIFIGQWVDPQAISGMALTFPFMNLLAAFGMLIGVGAASRVSILLGQNDKDKAENVLGNALVLTFIVSGTVVVLSFIFISDLLHLFGGTERTVVYAEDFMRIIIAGGVFSALSFGFNNIMRAAGYPKKAMYTTFLSVGVNLLLAPIFILVFKMGIRGAALATVCAYLVGAIWVLQHFMSSKSNLNFRRKNFRLKKEIVGAILSIGMSPFSIQVAASFVVVVTNVVLIDNGGDDAIGAFGIVNSIATLIIMVVVGLNQGLQPIIGYNYGAKQYDRMFKTLKTGSITAICITSFGFLLGVFFPDAIVSIFFPKGESFEMQQMASRALRLIVAVFPIVGFQIVITNFFQSIGRARISIFLSITRQFIFLIPFLFVLPRYFALDGAWMAFPASDFLSTIVTAVTIVIFIRKFDKSVLN